LIADYLENTSFETIEKGLEGGHWRDSIFARYTNNWFYTERTCLTERFKPGFKI